MSCRTILKTEAIPQGKKKKNQKAVGGERCSINQKETKTASSPWKSGCNPLLTTRLLSPCFPLKVRLATTHTSLLLVSDERMQGKQTTEGIAQCWAPSRASNTSISHGVTYPSGILQDARTVFPRGIHDISLPHSLTHRWSCTDKDWTPLTERG